MEGTETLKEIFNDQTEDKAIEFLEDAINDRGNARKYIKSWHDFYYIWDAESETYNGGPSRNIMVKEDVVNFDDNSEKCKKMIYDLVKEESVIDWEKYKNIFTEIKKEKQKNLFGPSSLSDLSDTKDQETEKEKNKKMSSEQDQRMTMMANLPSSSSSFAPSTTATPSSSSFSFNDSLSMPPTSSSMSKSEGPTVFESEPIKERLNKTIKMEQEYYWCSSKNAFIPVEESCNGVPSWYQINALNENIKRVKALKNSLEEIKANQIFSRSEQESIKTVVGDSSSFSGSLSNNNNNKSNIQQSSSSYIQLAPFSSSSSSSSSSFTNNYNTTNRSAANNTRPTLFDSDMIGNENNGGMIRKVKNLQPDFY